MHSLIEALGLAHGRFQGKRADILPVLLEERNQEVHGLICVGQDLLLGHLDVTNGDSKGKHLLHLKFNCAAHIINAILKILLVVDEDRKLASLVQTRTNDLGNLLDKGGGSKKGIVLLRKLLDELLVLIELLQSIYR